LLNVRLAARHDRPRAGILCGVDEPNLRDATVLTSDTNDPSRFTAEISADWTIVHVFGGVAMYVVLRAMRDSLAETGLTPLAATALFLAPVPAGRVTIDVDRLRAGRSTAQLTGSLRPGEQTEPAVQVQALFGAVRSSDLSFQNVLAPVVPPPHDVALRRHSPDIHFNFDDRTEWRPISGIDDPHSDRVLAWERIRVGEPDLLGLTLHSDILGVAVEQHGPFTILSLEIAVRFLATPATPWVLQEVEAWHVGDGYATGPARLWDERGRLCAIVNQTAQVRPAHTA